MTGLKQKICNLIRDDGHRSIANQVFSKAIGVLIIINVAMVVLDLIEVFPENAEFIFNWVETITVTIFIIEYMLRFWTADLMYPRLRAASARFKFARSTMSIVDILAILPFFLPFVTVNLTAIRLLRMLRLLRLMKLNRYSETKTYKMVLESIKDGFVLLDASHKFLSSNKAAGEIFPSLNGIGKYTPISKVKNWPANLASFDENTDSVTFVLNGDNHYRANISKVYDDGDRLLRYIVLIRDYTESVLLMRAEKEIVRSKIAMLEMSANMDVLTSIHNRRYFMDTAGKITATALVEGTAAHIILFDLDHFKSVNDTFGHPAGDKVLQDIAKWVRSKVRPNDLFARYGGEEFIILMENIDKDAVFERVEAIRQAICKAPVEFEDVKIPISASFGIASVQDGGNLEGAISCADLALYDAKKTGRNKAVVYAAQS